MLAYFSQHHGSVMGLGEKTWWVNHRRHFWSSSAMLGADLMAPSEQVFSKNTSQDPINWAIFAMITFSSWSAEVKSRSQTDVPTSMFLLGHIPNLRSRKENNYGYVTIPVSLWPPLGKDIFSAVDCVSSYEPNHWAPGVPREFHRLRSCGVILTWPRFARKTG